MYLSSSLLRILESLRPPQRERDIKSSAIIVGAGVFE